MDPEGADTSAELIAWALAALALVALCGAIWLPVRAYRALASLARRSPRR